MSYFNGKKSMFAEVSGNVNIDKTYNPESLKAQSGRAVAQALDSIRINVDEAYNPESLNPQSGRAVAQALGSIGGGGKGTPTTLCDITLSESVNSIICVDENSFPDLTKVQDLYVYIELPSGRAFKESGDLYIRFNNNYVFAVVSGFDSSISNITKWLGYSINVPNVGRFNLTHKSFQSNDYVTSLNVMSTCEVMNVPITQISISTSVSDSDIPKGSKIKIIGWLEQ